MTETLAEEDKQSIITVIDQYRADFIGLESNELSKDDRIALMTVHRELSRIKALILEKRSTRSEAKSVTQDTSASANEVRPEPTVEESEMHSKEHNTFPNVRYAVEYALSLPRRVEEQFKRATFSISRRTGRIIQLKAGKKRKHDGFLTRDDIERDCIICMETFLFDELVRVPCCHHYCYSCLRELVVDSLKDETLFKPKCCKQDIPLSLIHNILNKDQRDSYALRELEVESTNRTYCSNGSCTIFIHPRLITGAVATCEKCSTRTCITCKSTAHLGDCPQDDSIKLTEELAEKEGWKRCPVCKRMVELRAGCNHVSCLCGKHWCFVCVEPWKTCQCPSWTQDNLRARAEQNVARLRPALLQNYADAPVYQPRAPAQQPHQPRAPARQQAPVTLPRPVQQQSAPVYYQPAPVYYHPAPVYIEPVYAYQQQLQLRNQAEAQRQYQWRVQKEMAYLEANHECEHTNWQSIRGRHQCENCNWWAPIFIYRCRQCRLQACRRCKQNRIMV